MIGGGTGKKSRRGKHASSYDGKSPEEIQKVKKARKAVLKKARRMNQSQQKADEEKEKAKARMKTSRAREKQKREDMSCSFEKTKVWEVPGKDYYNDVDFESNPEVAVQLWYDNNGTWLLRESKWLVAYLHLDDMMSKDALERSRPVLTKLLTKVIRSQRTLIEGVHSVFGKEEWAAQRKWQEDNCIEDSEMAALRWLDDNGSDIHDNSFECISRDFDKAWTDSLVGRLKVKVPGRGVFILDSVDNSNTNGGRCICKYVGPKTCKSIEKCLCKRECFIRLTYEKVKEYVDKDEPSFPELDLPDFPKECQPSYTEVVDEAWAKKLIGLKLQVPQHWWEKRKTKKRLKGTKLWKCEIASIKLDDEEERYFILKSLDPDDEFPDDRYPMAYEAVKEYADEKDPKYSTFDLPPFQRQAAFVDWEHVSLLQQTKESLTKEEWDDAKIRAILREYCMGRITQIQEHQRMTPEKQHELGATFLEAQGRGVSWGKEKFNDKSIDAPLCTCASCGSRDFDCDERQYQYVDLNELDILKLDNEQWGEHVDRMEQDDGDPLCLPVDKDGNTAVFQTHKAYSVWPQDDKLVENLCQERSKVEGSRGYDDCLFEYKPCGGFCCPPGMNGKKLCTRQHDKRVKFFHLHPEFVEEYKNDNKKVGFKAKVCSDCYWSITNKDKKTGKPKPMIPELSIASGVDLGNYRRIGIVYQKNVTSRHTCGLTPLTPRERHIISKVRHCIHIVKIESNSGANNGDEAKKSVQYNHHSTIKGCGIVFDHNSPRVVQNLLTPESINGDIQLQFVCHKGEYDRLVAKAIGSANVKGRALVIYQWLKVLERINKWYKGDEELQELPPFSEFNRTMDVCNNELIKKAEQTYSEDLERQVNIARDDYAGIRARTTSDVNMLDDDEGESDGDDFPMKHVYLTDSEKTPHGNRADHDHRFIVDCANTLKVSKDQQVGVKVSQAKYKEAVTQEKMAKSHRQEEPKNEFLTGDEGLVKAFPDVFLLGTGYDVDHTRAPRLTPKQRKHLLRQFTCAAASCAALIFYLFNQMQRHDVVRAVHAKTQDREKFDDFVKEYTSPEFQAKLQKAVAKPHSPDGKYVMRKIAPMLTSVGRSVTFGAVERDQSKGEILALGRRFGCAPTFLTFAIDDVNSAPSIRLVTPSSDNKEFPSQVSGEAYEALRNGFGLAE